MKSLTMTGLALGLSALVLAASPHAGDSAAAAPQVQAPKQIVNAIATVRAASDLARTFQSIVSTQQAPAWIAYRVPTTPGEHHSCGYMNGAPTRQYLEGRRDQDVTLGGGRVALEGSREITVLYRVRQAQVHKIRVFSEDCELDAGGLPVFWLTGVDPDESVSVLSTFVKAEPESRRRERDGNGPRTDEALVALALHQTPAATRSLSAFVAAPQPLSVRKRAAFWLGAARGREGFEILQSLAAAGGDDPAFRRELVFPISISKEPEAIDLLLRMAKSEESRDVRQQALFWVGQKAGAKAAALLSDVVANDPDTEIKKRAVFSLSQLPKDEGIPRLIQVARTNANPAVRKQAMFWLGQSGDPRALSFFEEILKK